METLSGIHLNSTQIIESQVFEADQDQSRFKSWSAPNKAIVTFRSVTISSFEYTNIALNWRLRNPLPGKHAWSGSCVDAQINNTVFPK